MNNLPTNLFAPVPTDEPEALSQVISKTPKIETYAFDTKDVRVVMQNDEPWFVGKDVAEALGYSNHRDALSKHVDTEDKADVAIHDGSQKRSMVCINESGIYALIFGSKLEGAKQFKKWVTSEVLPSIRKTGSYTKPMTQLEMRANWRLAA